VRWEAQTGTTLAAALYSPFHSPFSPPRTWPAGRNEPAVSAALAPTPPHSPPLMGCSECEGWSRMVWRGQRKDPLDPSPLAWIHSSTASLSRAFNRWGGGEEGRGGVGGEGG
jgi:hypothetical protein